MDLFVACDRHGWVLKNEIVSHLKETVRTHTINDMCEKHDGIADAPSYAFFVAWTVAERPNKNFGILVSRTGNEMAIPCNRIDGIRACVCLSKEQAKIAKKDNDANILVIPSDIELIDSVKEIVDSFISNSYNEFDIDNLRRNRLIDVRLEIPRR